MNGYPTRKLESSSHRGGAGPHIGGVSNGGSPGPSVKYTFFPRCAPTPYVIVLNYLRFRVVFVRKEKSSSSSLEEKKKGTTPRQGAVSMTTLCSNDVGRI